MAVSAFLFDLDGTLWDSHPWFARLIAEHSDRDETRVLSQLRSRGRAAPLLRGAGITRAKFQALCTSVDGLTLYTDVAETLEALKGRGTAMAAVTNLPGWIANPMIRCLDLADLLSSVVTWECTTRHKPQPHPLLAAAEALGVRVSKRLWYIGDSASDGAAASRAGMSFAWAEWGYAPEQPPGTAATLHGFRDVLTL